MAENSVAARDLDALVTSLLDNPEGCQDLDGLTDEELSALRQKLNPYAGRAGPLPNASRKKIAVMSMTNLAEAYQRRLALTSAAAFLTQVAGEWDVPPALRRWTPKNAKKGRDNQPGEPFSPTELADRLEQMALLARQAAAAEEEAAAARTARDGRDLTAAPGTETAEETARLYGEAAVAEARAVALLYSTTHMLMNAGADAGRRLAKTAEAGRKYPSVREVLDRAPPPPAPTEVEMPADKAKEIVKAFVNHWFVFDPTRHVRPGRDPVVADLIAEARAAAGAPAERPVPPNPTAAQTVALAKIENAPMGRAAARALLGDAELAKAVAVAQQAPESFLTWLAPVAPHGAPAPPQDTFHRFNFYSDSNYEELRAVCEALYPERSELDSVVAVWDVYEGTDEECKKAFTSHVARYEREAPGSLVSVEVGQWVFTGEFRKNREVATFDNAETGILKRIIDRHAEDAKMGAELMRKRVQIKKAENIAECGPDAPGLAGYKASQSSAGAAATVITPAKMKLLEAAKGDLRAAQELEVLQQHSETVKRLSALALQRPLTSDESHDLAIAKRAIPLARDMLNVPEDAVRVDVNVFDAESGTFKTSHFFTEADAPAHLGVDGPAGAAAGAPAAPPAPAAARRDNIEVPSGLPPAAAASWIAAANADVPQFAPYALETLTQPPAAPAQ